MSQHHRKNPIAIVVQQHIQSSVDIFGVETTKLFFEVACFDI